MSENIVMEQLLPIMPVVQTKHTVTSEESTKQYEFLKSAREEYTRSPKKVTVTKNGEHSASGQTSISNQLNE